MKQLIFRLMAAMFLMAFAASCQKKDGLELAIGATPQPHAEILNFIKSDFEAKGFKLKIVEFTDYVAPNSALIDGSIDANFFQHIPYLEERVEWVENLVSVFGVHVEPFALYSLKYKTIDELPNGTLIAIPNDPTNGGRAMLLLEENGLVKLKPNAGLAATEHDIIENPREFNFVAMEAAALPSGLRDVGAACINGNFALQAGFNTKKDSLIIEGAASPYVNIVVVRKGNENDPRITALKEIMLSPKTRDFINKTWTDGSVIPVF
ncbi:MAG: MetQ/NlpA family ABC transporter substrate-binding protein [Spirochaetaceae bacterium]|jgi:D-methionine transport system substrate-binding protein|nr:MetQ/NlpA family ABC transporter substrate-binding protein [Spirochaetaceae bacterium]GMO26584.1 MAG: MetQ/NlpA family ABC transporter substrate-binding protein [Termitinemataceae bacterium]